VAGTYLLDLTGASEDHAATGDLDLNGDTVTIANTSGGTISIDGDNADRVFDVGPLSAAQLTLTGVTIQHGNPAPDPDSGIRGGGIRVRPSSSLAADSVTITNNMYGGVGYRGTVTLTNSAVTNNGSGVSADAVSVSNSDISNNGTDEPGISGGVVTISNSTVNNQGWDHLGEPHGVHHRSEQQHDQWQQPLGHRGGGFRRRRATRQHLQQYDQRIYSPAR
jgi:hypothetical protein